MCFNFFCERPTLPLENQVYTDIYMSQHQLEYYLDRLAEGSITKEEWKILHELAMRPEHADAFATVLDQQLATLAANGAVYPDVIANVQQGVQQQIIREKGLRLVSRRFLRYAAAIILLASAATGFLMWNNGQKNPVQQADVAPGGARAVLTLGDGTTIVLDDAADGRLAQQGGAFIVKLSNGQIAYNTNSASSSVGLINKISTPKGGQYQITLPDGTKAWLNAASSITFPSMFKADKRKIQIEGEVYLEVAKDESKPFIVEVKERLNVEVLGTSFNINSYADEGNIKTTLLEGRVRVSPPAGPSVTLRPGQQAIAAATLKVIDHANIDQAVAWKNGIFSFQNTDIRQVMKELERWYDIQVKYEGDIPRRQFGGQLSRDLKLSQIIQILSDMEVKFKIEGKTLIVSN